MKIGFDARILLCPGRGMKRATWELIRALARQDRSNQYYLFSDRLLNLSEELPENFHSVVLTKKLKFLPWSNTSLVKGAKDLRIDIMHFTYNNLWVRKPCKTVLTLNDVIPFTKKEEKFRTIKQRLAGISYLWAVKHRADQIITISNESRERICSLLRLDPARIEVIYPGVNLSFFSDISTQAIEAIKRKFNITNNYLFYVGGFDPRKNLRRTIDAYELATKKLPQEINLVIGGNFKSPEGREIKHYAKAKGLNKKILFTGWINDNELAALYKGAKAFLFPSLAEGFGLPVLEAMASGVPVITSNCSSLKEVAGSVAFLINPRNTEEICGAIVKILTEDALAQELVKRGLARASEFSWELTAQRILDIYNKVFGEFGSFTT